MVNIYVLNEDPLECAKELPNTVVSCLTMDLSRLLIKIATFYGFENKIYTYNRDRDEGPLFLWGKSNLFNLSWLLRYAKGLAETHYLRYNTPSVASEIALQVTIWFIDYYGLELYNCWDLHTPLEPFAKCIPEKYWTGDIIESHRLTLQGEKGFCAAWRHPHPRPEWWVGETFHSPVPHRASKYL